MELKVFWVTAFADTSHLGMLVAAENKEESLELAQDRVEELIYDCPSLAEFRDANYTKKCTRSYLIGRAPHSLEEGALAHSYCVPITFMSSLLEWLIEMIVTIGISSPFGFLLESG